jgi:hypothetical protein
MFPVGMLRLDEELRIGEVTDSMRPVVRDYRI